MSNRKTMPASLAQSKFVCFSRNQRLITIAVSFFFLCLFASYRSAPGLEPSSLRRQEPAQKNENGTQEKMSTPDSDQENVELPWERKREHRIPRVTELNERELLADVSEEEVLGIRDHLALGIQNPHLFAKLLFRVPQIGLDSLLRLGQANAEIDSEQLAVESGFHRLKVFRIEGRARYWEKRKLPPEVGELFDLSEYYKVKIRTIGNKNALVYCHHIPNAWKKNQKLDEQVFCDGFFVNTTWSKEKEPILNFVADRVGWVPDNRTGLVSEQGHSLLGSAGFDLGLFDQLPSRNKRRLGEEDQEIFYQMLAAAKLIAKSRNSLDWKQELKPLDLIQVLGAPDKCHGQLSTVSVQVRNVTPVQVDKAYIRDRLGIETYYQLDGFVKFDSTVTYKGDDGEPGAVFKEKYPISICVNELPSGWKAGGNQNYLAVFPAFFFKVWAYPSGYQNQFSKESMQLSPLLIALDPIQVEVAPEEVNWMAIGLVSVLAVGLLAVWTSYFLRRAKKDKNATQFQLPGKVKEAGLMDQLAVPDNEKQVPGMPVIKE